MTTLALITPLDPATGTRVNVRVCSSQARDATGAGGLRWLPAMSVQPELRVDLFDGDFSSPVSAGTARIEIRLDVLRRSAVFPGLGGYDWSGAKVRLYRLVDGLPLDLAVMKVGGFAVEAMSLGLSLEVDEEPFAADVLFRTYAGTTGAEGGADLKGGLKPWVFGRARNVEPVFIDQIDNVFQVSGYGPVQAISATYERGASFGASVGDFASYAALVAAPIPPGRWGTCLAEGLIRLGAPPAGVITVDVDGDTTSGFLRRTGAVLKEIARRLGLSEMIDDASFDALDAAVPRDINIVLTEQTSLLDLAQRMAAPCNAVAGLGLDGRLIVPRVAIGAPALVLDAQGRQMPPVLSVSRQNTSPPYKRIQMGAARCWRVHSLDEIAFTADLIERGLYDAATVYREGNIVTLVNKSRWLYINPVPSSGNAPPIWPTTSNAWWDNLEPPASEDPAIANSEVMIPGLVTALPAEGAFDGQQVAATDTGEVFRWDQSSVEWVRVSDITATAQRSIEPQFPVIEIKEGEAGHTGTRTVTHIARRGTATLTGGTWSIVSTDLTGATVTINSSTGTVSISGVTISGRYVVRYTHTDGIETDRGVNVSYIPAAAVAPIGVFLQDLRITGIVVGAPAPCNYVLTNAGEVTSSFKANKFWINPQTGMSDYEVRATLLSGTIVTGTFGSWLNLGTTRTWSNTRATVGQNIGEMLVEIRLASTGDIVATAVIGLWGERQ